MIIYFLLQFTDYFRRVSKPLKILNDCKKYVTRCLEMLLTLLALLLLELKDYE